MTEQVILVNEQDEPIGQMEKMEAHRRGLLHRAFSIFVVNSRGELLLQKRAGKKYHSGGLWTNTCCSHPRPGENLQDAAARRLREEMGLKCELTEVFSFVYKITFADGLTEYEYDHVLMGWSDTPPALNPEEAEEWRYASPQEILQDIKQRPEAYTEWLKISMEKISDLLHNHSAK